MEVKHQDEEEESDTSNCSKGGKLSIHKMEEKPLKSELKKEEGSGGQYQDPWQYVDDIWLMFNNAWLYNRKTSRVYKFCSKLAEVFEQEIDPVMQGLGYCCGRK
ncbi:hypothetical protein XENOCAPTIV_020766, partial [Xenoophorus captivus]